MERAETSLLIVEDEPLVAMSLVDAFEECGYRVSVCGTGYDALNYIEMEGDIVALVTDIRLGDGPDGWEIARRARAHFPATPVIYITGDSAGDYGEHAVPKSVILQKPFPIAQLIKTVSSLLQ
jgi:CheY-like chemotaxis protein